MVAFVGGVGAMTGPEFRATAFREQEHRSLLPDSTLALVGNESGNTIHHALRKEQHLGMTVTPK